MTKRRTNTLELVSHDGLGGFESLSLDVESPTKAEGDEEQEQPVEVEEVAAPETRVEEVKEDGEAVTESPEEHGSETTTSDAGAGAASTLSLDNHVGSTLSAATSSVSVTSPPPPGKSSKVSLPMASEPIPLVVEENVGGAPLTPTHSSGEQPGAQHVASPGKGPSMMQKVVSFTRQRDLPPKDKEEEKKHLRELEAMLAASKESEKRRKSQVEATAAMRAATFASSLPTWESSILPNWRSVLRPDPEGVSLRQLWWEGSMPVRFRGRLWGMVISNGLAVSKSAYSTTLARAKKGIEEGRYPKEIMDSLLADVEITLPKLKMFQPGGAMYEDLVDVLLAYSIFDGAPRYPRGISFPCAMLLINMSAAEAFLSLVNLVHKSVLKSFYSENTAEIDAYQRIFDTLLADAMPNVYASTPPRFSPQVFSADPRSRSPDFSHEVVRPALYLTPWLTSVFVRFLPLDLSTRLFDVFLLEGDSFLFRLSLVLLQILEPRLFNPVLSELDDVFKGEDKGALSIVMREMGALGLEWGTDDVYSEMGVTEEEVFRRLKSLEWKEQTWERLVERELPDAD